MIRGYKMRLLPTKEQTETLNLWRIKARSYHNFLLYNQTKFDNYDVMLNMVAAGGSVLEARKAHWPVSAMAACNNNYKENGFNAYQNGTNFFNLPGSAALGTLKNLAEGWKKFFDFKKNPSKYPHLVSARAKKAARGKNVYGFGRPKFFPKNEFPNLCFSNNKPKIVGEGKKRKMRVPTLGMVKFITDRDIPANIKQFTIQELCGKWYVSIIADDGRVPASAHYSEDKIGIDVGIRHFVTKSDATFKDVPKETKEALGALELKIKRIQKKMARQTKFGKNWNKSKEDLKKTHSRKSEILNNFIHKISKDLTDNYCEVHREDLKITNMVRSAAGTVDEPGVNVSAKSGLNRSILSQGWGKLFLQLDYKSIDKGGKVVKVNPRNTSRGCPSCGHVEAENRKDEKFKCKKCSYENHADVVGAINVLNRGLLGDSLPSPVRALGRNSDASTSCDSANVAKKTRKTAAKLGGSRKRSPNSLKLNESDGTLSQLAGA